MRKDYGEDEATETIVKTPARSTVKDGAKKHTAGKKINKNNYKMGYFIAVCVLSVTAIGIGLGWGLSSGTAKANASALEGLYQNAFYELSDNVNAMEAEVGKLLLTANAEGRQQALLDIKQQSDRAQVNLGRLPAGGDAIRQTAKFINQLNDYVTGLLNYDGEAITEEQLDNLGGMYKYIEVMQEEFNDVAYKITQGYSITDNFPANFAGLSTEEEDEPVMIYRGPLSAQLTGREIKGLSKTEASEGDARDFVKDIFKAANADIEYLGETNGRFKTYDYKVKTKDHELYVQVAKRSKFLLSISGNVTDGENKISAEQAKQKALEFVDNLGIKDMHCVHEEGSHGAAYINLVPVLSGVVIYPDLIKVKVDLSSGDVVGYEAQDYAYNHTERKFDKAKYTEKQARSRISSKIDIKNSRLCIIPLEFGGETLAYEFEGDYGNGHYLIYTDAGSNEQLKVMKVIVTGEGELVL